MTPADRKVLRAAAALISEDAKLMAESCQLAGQARRWVCEECTKDSDGKCQAQRDYETRVEAHRKLMAIARRA